MRIALGKIMEFDDELVTLGLRCPLPVLKARKRLSQMADGAVLRLVSDDPVSVVDVPFFCSEAGHDLLARDTDNAEGTVFTYLIRKRP